jgi:hypothetical protein
MTSVLGEAAKAWVGVTPKVGELGGEMMSEELTGTASLKLSATSLAHWMSVACVMVDVESYRE